MVTFVTFFSKLEDPVVSHLFKDWASGILVFLFITDATDPQDSFHLFPGLFSSPAGSFFLFSHMLLEVLFSVEINFFFGGVFLVYFLPTFFFNFSLAIFPYYFAQAWNLFPTLGDSFN